MISPVYIGLKEKNVKINNARPTFVPSSEGEQERQTGDLVSYVVSRNKRRVQDGADVQSGAKLRSNR